jgi:hypothetical protein
MILTTVLTQANIIGPGFDRFKRKPTEQELLRRKKTRFGLIALEVLMPAETLLRAIMII